MKNFKDASNGLIKQVDDLLEQELKQELKEQESTILLRVISTLIDSIELKILEQSQIQSIFKNTQVIIGFLLKNKYNDKIRKLIELGKGLQIKEIDFGKIEHEFQQQSRIISPDSVQDPKIKYPTLEELLSEIRVLYESKEERYIEKEFAEKEVKFIFRANIDLINIYASNSESTDIKLQESQQNALNKIVDKLLNHTDKMIAHDFVYAIIERTLKLKIYDQEWKKELLKLLFYVNESQLNQSIPISDEKNENKNLSNLLKQCRENLKKEITIENLFMRDDQKRLIAAKEYSSQVKTIIQKVLNNCTSSIYPPSEQFEFCLLSMGSISRDEMLPYSDLECLCLFSEDEAGLDIEVKKPSPKSKYLDSWIKLFRFYMIGLGESIPGKLGFRLDGEGSEPNQNQLIKANPGNHEFRKNPETLFQEIEKGLQDHSNQEDDSRLIHSFLNVDYLYGTDKKRLFNKYREKLLKKSNGESQLDKKYEMSFSQRIAINQLKKFNESYNKKIKEKSTKGDLKEFYWQFLVYPLYFLALYYDPELLSSEERNTLFLISSLEKYAKISSQNSQQLKILVSDLYHLRWKLHDHHGHQVESILQDDSTFDKTYYERMVWIQDIFKKFYHATSNFINTQSWSLDQLPESYNELLKKCGTLEKENILLRKERDNDGSKLISTKISPTYHVLVHDVDKKILKIKERVDVISPLESHIIAYEDKERDDDDEYIESKLKLLTLLFVYGKEKYSQTFSIESLLNEKNILLCKNSTSQESLKEEKFFPIRTKGDGDCPFHAVLGEFSTNKKMFICEDVNGKRTLMKNAIHKISDIKETSTLKKLVIEGVQAIIMANTSIGEATKNILVQWCQFNEKEKENNNQNWLWFEKELKKAKFLVDFVEKNGTPKGIQTLREKFYDVLFKKNYELRMMIGSSEELKLAFCNYEQKQNKGFLWENLITSDVIKEYGDFVEKPYTWLLPLDLNIIALVFNTTIYYYASLKANPQIYNPDQKDTVYVRMCNNNHYEQLMRGNANYSEQKSLDYLNKELSSLSPNSKQLVSDITDSKNSFYPVRFEQFYDFCVAKIKPKDLYSDQKEIFKESFRKLLCITTAHYNYRFYFDHSIITERQKVPSTLGQTIQFRFCLKSWDLYLVQKFNVNHCDEIKENAVFLTNANTAYVVVEGKGYMSGTKPQRVTGINRQGIRNADISEPRKYEGAEKDSIIKQAVLAINPLENGFIGLLTTEAKLIAQNIMVTIVFSYNKDQRPSLIAFVKDQSGLKLIKFERTCHELKNLFGKYKTDSFMKQIDQFWKLPPIRKKWQDASLVLLEEQKWLTNALNIDAFNAHWQRLLNDYVNNNYNNDKNLLRAKLDQNQAVKRIVDKASMYIKIFMVHLRVKQHVLADYRNMDSTEHESRLIQAHQLPNAILLLKQIYKNLILFTESNQFDIIGKICQLSRYVQDHANDMKDMNAVRKSYDRLMYGLTLMHIVTEKIIAKWSAYSEEMKNQTDWFWPFFTVNWGVIGEHISEFKTLKRETRDQLMINLTVFNKELERTLRLDSVRDSDTTNNLYNGRASFFGT